ncbi:50S ribosomal protein L29 [Lyngbya sp. CCY1209]|jgi:large subunit ribosomal protein L29|uniref:50S ribosomal protein L29 n=1 Tax=Lyngbya sp. CCY1209 TaxID=2886103 RepID=UPI002D215134|nr:50S ribosomal protein L29 [Lyngbya sp. CCY1209]MEB3884488.1 50S ribosomal protein L29 [Lyngbya sp. CCY1209]
MPLPNIEDARQLGDEELSETILDIKKELANLRLLKATGRLEKPHEIRHARHRLAQLLTVERQRQLEAEAPAAATE